MLLLAIVSHCVSTVIYSISSTVLYCALSTKNVLVQNVKTKNGPVFPNTTMGGTGGMGNCGVKAETLKPCDPSCFSRLCGNDLCSIWKQQRSDSSSL